MSTTKLKTWFNVQNVEPYYTVSSHKQTMIHNLISPPFTTEMLKSNTHDCIYIMCIIIVFVF